MQTNLGPRFSIAGVFSLVLLCCFGTYFLATAKAQQDIALSCEIQFSFMHDGVMYPCEKQPEAEDAETESNEVEWEYDPSWEGRL